MKIYFSLDDFKDNALKSTVLVAFLLLAILCLFYIFHHNPHQALQNDIIASAGKIHNYYREKPGYWQLSCSSSAS